MNDLIKREYNLGPSDPLEGEAWEGIGWLLRHLDVDGDYSHDRDTAVIEGKEGRMSFSLRRMPASNFVQISAVADRYRTSISNQVDDCAEIVVVEGGVYDVKAWHGIRIQSSVSSGWLEVIAIPKSAHNQAFFAAKALYTILRRRYATRLLSTGGLDPATVLDDERSETLQRSGEADRGLPGSHPALPSQADS